MMSTQSLPHQSFTHTHACTHTHIYSLLPPFLSIIHTQHTRAFECGTRKCSPSIWLGWITPSRVPSVDSSDPDLDLGGVTSLPHGSPDNAFKLGQYNHPKPGEDLPLPLPLTNTCTYYMHLHAHVHTKCTCAQKPQPT